MINLMVGQGPVRVKQTEPHLIQNKMTFSSFVVCIKPTDKHHESPYEYCKILSEEGGNCLIVSARGFYLNFGTQFSIG